MAKKWWFEFAQGDKVAFGDLEGKVTLIDNDSMFGIECSFIDDKGKDVVVYFNKDGKYSGQDDNNKLRRKG